MRPSVLSQAHRRAAVEASISCLLQMHEIRFPVDPMTILSAMQNVSVKSYREKARKCRLSAEEYDDLLSISQDGFSMLYHGRYRVWFNQDITSPDRVRFTLAHELGHILLKHHAECPPREGISVFSQVYEEQANVFAANLLSPSPIMNLLRNDGDLSRRLFGLSLEAWTIRRSEWRYDLSLLSDSCTEELIHRAENQIFRKECRFCHNVFIHREPVCLVCGSRQVLWCRDEKPLGLPFLWSAEDWQRTQFIPD